MKVQHVQVSADKDKDVVGPQTSQPVGLQHEALSHRVQSNPLGQDYLQWKERILREARASLQLQESQVVASGQPAS